MKTQPLKQALDKYGFDAAFGGARRDEEALARQGARVLVPLRRPSLGSAPSASRRCGTCSTGASAPARRCACSRCRTGPRATCGATSCARSSTSCRSTSPPRRPTIMRNGQLLVRRRRPPAAAAGRGAADEERALPHARLLAADRRRRLRRPTDIESVVAETLGARTSERQGRLIDHDQAGAMESKKQEGYF